MNAVGQVLDLAEKGQDLTIVGVLFSAIGLLLIALFFLVRHYIAQFKKTDGRREAFEKKVQAILTGPDGKFYSPPNPQVT